MMAARRVRDVWTGAERDSGVTSRGEAGATFSASVLVLVSGIGVEDGGKGAPPADTVLLVGGFVGFEPASLVEGVLGWKRNGEPSFFAVVMEPSRTSAFTASFSFTMVL